MLDIWICSYVRTYVCMHAVCRQVCVRVCVWLDVSMKYLNICKSIHTYIHTQMYIYTIYKIKTVLWFGETWQVCNWYNWTNNQWSHGPKRMFHGMQHPSVHDSSIFQHQRLVQCTAVLALRRFSDHGCCHCKRDPWIGWRENLNQKPWSLPVKMGVSCKCSLKPIQWRDYLLLSTMSPQKRCGKVIYHLHPLTTKIGWYWTILWPIYN